MKTRFAPSPTGLIHFGNVRTALFNVLLARSKDGSFLLRIEDTDPERSKKEFERSLINDLKWLGLNWQEGVGITGPHEPYHQADRQSIYNNYYKMLEDKSLAYPCFCTEEQLALSRKLQRARGIAPRYAGTCRHLSKEEVDKKLADGLKPTLRFRVPDDEVVEFEDFVKGKQSFKAGDIGDFIIRRSNGLPSFMFCNAIDDSLMEVTHVMRGEDHLTNTPRQLMILKALDMPAPTYGHISLILGMDGSPLSKRNGSRSVQDLREYGYLPSAVVNYLARLGHYYESNEFMSLDKLAENFSMSNLGKAPARYDEAQLLYYQKQAMGALSDEEFLSHLSDEIKNNIPADKQSAFAKAVKANVNFYEDVERWVPVFFGDIDLAEHTDTLKEAGKTFFETSIDIMKADSLDFKSLSNALKEKLGVKGKQLFMPLRVALTGEKHGPEMAAIFDLLGKEKIIKRFESALSHV